MNQHKHVRVVASPQRKTRLVALLALSCCFVQSVSATLASAAHKTPLSNVRFVPSRETSVLYAGAAVAPAANKSEMIVRAQLGTDATGEPEIELNEIGANIAGGLKEVTHLAVSPNGTVLSFVTPTAAGDEVKKVQQLYSPAASEKPAAEISAVLNDANGNATEGIVALASNDTYAFAAVREAGQAWTAGDERGIAVVKHGAAGTAPDQKQAGDLTTAAAGAPDDSLKLSVNSADNLVAFKDPAAAAVLDFDAQLTSNNVAMHWNPYNDRLYVGLGGIRRPAGQEGGVLGVTVGRVEADAFKLAAFAQANPGVIPTKALFYDAAGQNNALGIIGSYRDAGFGGGTVSVNKIASLHTSTGKDYLVVASEVAGSGPLQPTQSGVYALLLNSDTAAAEKTGSVAKVANWKTQPAAYGEMPHAADAAARIPLSLTQAQIADIFCEGDSVYVAANGANQAVAGLFQSRALFDENGYISSWTLPQQVLAGHGKVVGAGVDAATDTIIAVASEGRDSAKNANTVYATQWTAGKDSAPGDSNLRTVLAEKFPAEEGGVQQLFMFSEATPGFAANRLTLGVAISGSKVGLIQVAQREIGVGVNAGVAPTVDYAVAKVFVYEDNEVLKSIAPLTSACVVDGTNGGWLFVGGVNGVAVLSGNGGGLVANTNEIPAGSGWKLSLGANGGLAGLANTASAAPNTKAGYPGPLDATDVAAAAADNAGYTWKQLIPEAANLSNFDNVQKLIGTNGHNGDGQLFILTDKGFYRVVPTVPTMVLNTPNLHEVDLLRLPAYEVAYGPANQVTAAGFAAGAAVTALQARLEDAVLLDAVALDFKPGTAAPAAAAQQTFIISSTKGIDLIQITAPLPAGALTALLPAENFETAPLLDGKIILSLAYQSRSRSGATQKGELVALEADFSQEPSVGVLHRLAVNADGGFADILKLVAAAQYPLAQARAAVLPVGAGYLHTRGKHFGDTNYAETLMPSTRLNQAQDGKLADSVVGQSVVSLFDLDAEASLVGRPVVDPATGNVIVPGQWGVVVKG